MVLSMQKVVTVTNAVANAGANTGTSYVSVEPSFTQFSNSPIIILKSKYVISWF